MVEVELSLLCCSVEFLGCRLVLVGYRSGPGEALGRLWTQSRGLMARRGECKPGDVGVKG